MCHHVASMAHEREEELWNRNHKRAAFNVWLPKSFRFAAPNFIRTSNIVRFIAIASSS